MDFNINWSESLTNICEGLIVALITSGIAIFSPKSILSRFLSLIR